MRIGRSSKIICYDQVGMFAVARAAWMLRYFGGLDVRILNGGLNKWFMEGRTVYSGNHAPGEGLNPDEDYSGWLELDSTRAIRDIN